jgi:hypothetical protein
MSSFEDATAGIGESDIERSARVHDLLGELRPHANEITAQYLVYLTQFGDESKAFQALIMYLEVGLEVGKYDDKSMLALAAFLARRLANTMPNLARTLN